MRLIFWQNCISPHQMPYITELHRNECVDEVVVVASESISDKRRDMGWDYANYGDGTQIILSPTDDIIEELFSKDQSNSVHLFSGLRGFPFVFTAFKKSLGYNVRRGLITERPNTFKFGVAWGKPLWLHWLRWQIQDRQFYKYIDYVFAIGEKAQDFFNSLNKDWIVIPFMYCTKEKEYIDCSHSGGLSACFVGSLSWWKNVKGLLRAVNTQSEEYSLTLYGDGDMRTELEDYVVKKSLSRVSFEGKKMQSEIPSLLAHHDILVLPSVYDGWGAVVNEALQQGIYVICSDACGAKDLLKYRRRGLVFKSGSESELSSHLTYCMENIEYIRKTRRYRYEWATKYISGKTISRYMVDVLNGRKVTAPWLLDDVSFL